MNCPECDLLTSDDICPGCKKDLRRLKRANGIAVQNEGVPYLKLLKSLEAPTEIIQTSISLPSGEQKGIVAAGGAPWRDGEPTPDQLEGLFSFFKSEEEKLVHLAFEEDDEDLQKILREAESELGVSEPPASFDTPLPPKKSIPAPLPELVTASSEEVEVELEEVEMEFEVEELAPLLRPMAPTVYHLDFDFEEEEKVPPPMIEVSDEMGVLFQHADASLKGHHLDEIEFNIEQFFVRSRREDLELLFSLAHESLFDPTLLERFQEREISSTERKVEADTLVEEFQRIERQMSVVPSFQVKQLKKKAPTVALEGGKRSERFVSGAVDILATSALSLLASGYLLYHHSPLFRLQLSLLELPQSFDLFYLVSTSLLVLPLWLVLYHFVLLAVMGQTLGMKAAALRLVGNEESQPTKTQLLIHASALPCSLLVSWITSLFFNWRSLSDRLAELRLVRD